MKLILNVRRPWAHVLAVWLLLVVGMGASAVRAADNFLEPEKAFVFSTSVSDARSVEVRFDITPGYYLYREQFHFSAEGAALVEPKLPAGKVKFDETFQKQVETYHDGFRVQVPVTQAGPEFVLTVVAQGCAEAGLCYPPMTHRVKVSLTGFGGNGSVSALDEAPTAAAGSAAAASSPTATAPPAAVALPVRPPQATSLSDSANVERVLKGGSWWTVVGAFFAMGLLLSLTPCVLPMLPILSSIIVGGGAATRSRGLLLASCYSLGMAVVYTGFGIAAGLAGEGLAAWLQSPWVLTLFAALLGALALSMFDVYELQLPTALTTRLHTASQSLPGGQALGVFLMGGVSALIVSPCVTAPLAGALVFLSQTRDVTLGGTALFALSAGMSVPLLVLGGSAGSWLPKSGAWMHSVKHFFGLLLLGVALWVLQPVLPRFVVLASWGVFLLVVGFMLRPFDAHPHSAAPRVWFQRAAGLASLVLGVLQLAGAASGGKDPLQPLAHLAVSESAAAPKPATLSFRTVRSVDELDAALHNTGRPVMLDFYADWCVSCKEMERYTFSDPAVQRRLEGALLLKADVTQNTEQNRALLKRFHLFGPPGTIFFDATGAELAAPRVIGFQDAALFQQTLSSLAL